MAVYGYARVSTTRQANEGESLGVQRRMIDGYAHMHGFVLDEVLVEEGVSGSIPFDKRPAGGDLLARLRAGDIVIAARLDRCFRSALDALNVVEDLKARRIKLHILDLGGDVTGNGSSKYFLTMAAAFAEAERDRLRERISDVKTDQRDRGRYLGGKIPFGYRVGPNGDLVEHEEEMRAIEEMINMRESGMALRKIADAMKKKGLKVSHETVRQYHPWSHDDDIVAFYIWKYGDKNLPMNKNKIADKLGMTPHSIAMRGRNYHSIAHGTGGLSHPSQQSCRVYEENKDIPEPELREMVIRIITR